MTELVNVFEQIDQIWSLTVLNSLMLVIILAILIGIILKLRDF